MKTKKLTGIPFLWPYIKRKLSLVLLILMLSLLTSLLDLLPIQIIGTLVDKITNNNITGYRIIWVYLSGNNPVAMIILFAVMYLLSNFFSIVYGYMVSRFNYKLIFEVRSDAFKWVLYKFNTFKGNMKEGDIISRLTSDIEAITRAIAAPLNGLLTNILRLFWVLIIFIIWNPLLAISAISVTPFLYLATKWITKVNKEIAKKQREAHGALTNFINDILNNIPIIKGFQTEEIESLNFKPYNETIAFYTEKSLKAYNRYYWPLIHLFNIIGKSITLYLAYKMVVTGSISAGDILVTYIYVERIYNPIIQLSRYGNEIFQADAAVSRVFELKPDETEHKEVKSLTFTVPPSIEFKNFSIKINSNYLLKNLNLKINSGELVVLYGDSGSGKSTIIRSILGLEPIEYGDIFVDDKKLKKNLKQILKIMSISFQNSYIFDRSIMENLNYSNKNFDFEKSKKLLSLAGLAEIIDSRGYDFKLGSKGKNLSGGEQRRLSFVRALSKDALIYLLDEPTAELDSENGANVISIINELKGRATIIVSTHDSDLLNIADIIVTINKYNNGECICDKRITSYA